VVRIHYPPRALCSAPDQRKRWQGRIFVGPARSREVRLSMAICGRIVGRLIMPNGIPSAVDPPIGERARARRRHDATRARDGITLAAPGVGLLGLPGSAVDGHPGAGGLACGNAAWQEGPPGPTGACGSNGQDHDGRTTITVIEDLDRLSQPPVAEESVIAAAVVWSVRWTRVDGSSELAEGDLSWHFRRGNCDGRVAGKGGRARRTRRPASSCARRVHLVSGCIR
jgi:hypothetical protein